MLWINSDSGYTVFSRFRRLELCVRTTLYYDRRVDNRGLPFTHGLCNVLWKKKMNISEFTQQDGKKTRTAYPLCVTNVTRPLLACFVVNFTNINVFWSFTKRSVEKKVKFGEKLFETKLLSRLSHKVCSLLSSPVLLRKFTIDISCGGILAELSRARLHG